MTTKKDTDIDLSTDDQKEAQEVAAKLVEARHDAQTTVGPSDAEGSIEDAHEVAEQIVNRQHDNQQTIAPPADKDDGKADKSAPKDKGKG